MLLTAAVCRVTIRTEQEWNVIVLRSVVNPEDNRDLRIKAFDIEAREIGFGIEDQPISAALDRLAHQKERLHATVCVGPGVTKFGPTFVSVLHCQRNSNAAGRRAARNVENVRRDGAHCLVSSQWLVVSGQLL